MGLESTLANYYIQISHSTLSAVVLVSNDKRWKLIDVSPNGAWPNRPTFRKGTWAEGSFGWSLCYALGTGADAPSSNNQTQLEVFRLTDLDFPPDLSAREGFFNHQFRMGNLFAGEEHIPTGIQGRTAGGKLNIPTHGNWTAFATGPVLAAVNQRLKAAHDELIKLGIQIGLDIAAMVDPTGAFSIPASAYALRNGDYLGCAMNLLGVIPLFGKVADSAAVARISGRLTYLTKEITFMQRWLDMSANTARRLRQTSSVENALKVEIQGTTKASAVASATKSATGALQMLKNSGWLMQIRNAEKLGLLPEEVEVMRKLARDGYYFVIRSCNPARVEWLKLARDRGWGMIAKPVWLKIKSLKGVKFNGLVGFAKSDGEYRKTIKDLQNVAEIPAHLDLGWLAARGLSKTDVKVFRLTRGFNVPHVEDAEMMLSHYFVDTGDAFIIVDRFGKPYVPDLDIVTIQRAVGRGRYLPPGMNVGPKERATGFKGSDNAQLTAYWNAYFRSVRYPKGYDPFGWHGGLAGSAGFFSKNNKFDTAMGARSLGWNPEKPTEDLIVAVSGVENLKDQVGFVTGWDKLQAFQQANPGMGEWRFTVSQASH